MKTPTKIWKERYEDLKEVKELDNEKMRELEKEIEIIKAEISKLREEIVNKKVKIDELNEQNKGTRRLEDEVEKLGSEVEEKEKKLESLNKELDNYKEKIKELEISVRNYKFLYDKVHEPITYIQEEGLEKFELFLNRRLQEIKNASKRAKNKVDAENNEEVSQLLEEINESIDKLISSDIKLQKTKEEKARLEKEIAEKEDYKANLSPDSEEYKKLIADIERLKNELKSKEEEIKKLEEKITELKEELKQSYGVLQKKIEEKKKELDAKKNEYISEIKRVRRNTGSWGEKIKDLGKEFIGEKTIDEKIEKLLKAQIDIAKHNSSFAAEVKKELLKEMPELSDKLSSLCKKQAEITRLEMQLENTDKVFQVFNINQGVIIEGNNNQLRGISIRENKVITEEQIEVQTKNGNN